MCLDKGFNSIEKSSVIQSGWKKFGGYSPNLAFDAVAYKGSHKVPLDKWITAEGTEIKTGFMKSYEAGFHIYEDEQEIKGGSAHRVYYRNAHTRGRQNGLTVVVALDMYVPSDQNGWPPL